MTLQTGQILNNRYHIERLLAVGGFGSVYLCRDIQLDRLCAVKENLDNSADALRQFTREAHLLAQLSHPNLPRVSDYFEIPGGGQVLVMDFIEGEDLEAMRCQNGGALPQAWALPWIWQICDALLYLHGQNPPIIHRDIKPANIRITPEGKAVLVDFGIAKQRTSSKTTIGAKAVTPSYSPPEQYTGSGTDERSDVYALGATLYTLLTGVELPESIHRLMSQGTGTQPPHLVRMGIQPHVSQAIMRAIQPDPSRRFASIAEFQALLFAQPTQPVLTTQAVQPVQAQPAGRAVMQIAIFLVSAAALVICLVAASMFIGGKYFSTLVNDSSTPAGERQAETPRKIENTPLVVEPESLPTTTTAPTNTPTARPSPVPPTATIPAVVEPRIYDFTACLTPCNGSNAISIFPERTKKIFLNWKFENIPSGAYYERIWRVDGREWVRYVCNWDGPETGEADDLPNFNPLTDYEGLRSGEWELVMLVDGQELIQERITIEGKYTLWTPAGVINRCTGLK